MPDHNTLSVVIRRLLRFAHYDWAAILLGVAMLLPTLCVAWHCFTRDIRE